MGATETFMQSLQQKNGARVSTAMSLDTRNPDDVADQMRVGGELNLPANVIAADPQGFKRQLSQQKSTTALSGAPITSKWLQDLNNGALGKDDVENLSWFEKSTQGFADAYIGVGDVAEDTAPGRMVRRGLLRQSANPSQNRATKAATILADQGKSFDEIYADVLGELGPNAPASVKVTAQQVAKIRFDQAQGVNVADVARLGAEALSESRGIMAQVESLPMSDTSIAFRDGPLASAPDTLGGLASAFWDDPLGGAVFLGETMGEFLPTLAASAAVTMVTRSPAAGSVALGAGSFLSENAASAQAFLSEKGMDMSTPEAALDVLNDAELMREAGSRGATRGVIIGALDAMSGGVAGTTLAKSPVGDIMLQTMAQMALGGGGEALATVAVGDEISIKEVGLEALGEALTLPADLIIGGRAIQDAQSVAQSGVTAARIDELDSMAPQSKLKERSPEKFQELLDAQGDGSFYVPADDMREYFQARDITDEQMIADWGINPDDLADAESTGRDVAIPQATYTARLSGTDDAAWVRDNAITQDGEFSLSQAARFNEIKDDLMQRAIDDAERQRVDQEDVRAADVQIYDNVFSQLREAGRTRDVADNEARVWSSFWRTMGERYGADPMELAQSMGVDIRGPQTDVAGRRRGDLDLKLNTLRTQGEKALKPKGMGILEFVRDQGGLQDRGGDVEGMDAPSGVIAETASQTRDRESQGSMGGMAAQAKGKGLVELGRAMIEAGYFPEYMGGADIAADGTVIDEAAIALEAISEAISGRDRFQDGDGPDVGLTELYDLLNERGIDLALSNDDVVAALVDSGGQEFNQDGTRDTDSDAFKAWFGDSKVVDADGKPLVVYRAMDRDVDGGSFFQKYKEAEGPFGSIQMPIGGLKKGQTVINLFESANLSTFIHESGHFFLEAFAALASTDKAPQAMKDDMAAILKFLGVDSFDQVKTEHHEKWARGFEAYTMEGKAPSLALADSFARFKAWLTQWYKSALKLNVKITPDIRQVMDRMLATDAEIAEARATQQMNPLYSDQAAAGMSDAAWKTYQRFARRSVEQGEQKLLEKTMAKVRREKQKWWKKERADVRKEVEGVIQSQREYRLIEMLANQNWFGSDEAVPDFQIDRNQLVEAFSDAVIGELSRKNLGGQRAIYGADGMSLYEAADFFGFTNPVEMVETLQNTVKMKDAIEAETDRIMDDRYGDPLNDGSIEQEALDAIHSEAQADTVAIEARHLSAQAGRPTRNMTAKVFRQRARSMIGRMTVKEATRPDSFLAAERRAAKAAEDAIARVVRGRSSGPALAAAARHKEQQVLNHYLYLESRDLTKKVASKREKMRDYAKKSVREKFGEGTYELSDNLQAMDALHQIDAILEGYDFRVRSAKQIANAISLKDFVDRMVADGRADDMAIDARLVDNANRKHFTKMTVDEIGGLFDTIDNLDNIGRRWGKLISAKKRRDLAEIAGKVSGLVEGRYGSDKAKKQSGHARNFFNLNLTADTMLEVIDGEEMGGFYDELKAPIDEGQAIEQQMNVEMAHAVEDIYSVYTPKELAEMQAEKHIPGGNGHLWSKASIISLALNQGNPEGRARALETTVHPSRRLTQSQLDATLDTLSKEDFEFVQSVLNQVNTYWTELAAVHKRRTGTELKKVDSVPIETKFGTYPGGYYPISYDPELAVKSAQEQGSIWDQAKVAGRGAAKVSSGMTNERQATSGGRTVDYSLDVMFHHMRKTIRVISMSEAVDNAGRILKHPDVQSAFMEAGQTDQHETLNLFLDDLAVGPVYNTDPINSAARAIKNNFTMMKLAFNVKTVALQLTGISQSAAVVGKMPMLRGYRDYLAAPKSSIDMILKKSPMMAERKTSFQKDIYDQMNDVKLSSPMAARGTKAKNRMSQAGFWAMIKTQFLGVDVPTWMAGYDKEMRKSGDESKAVAYADRMVIRAQGGGLYADRTALSRGTVARNMRQADFIRMWTTLTSYMVLKMNRGYLSVEKGRMGIKGADGAGEALAATVNAAADLILLYVVEGAVMGLGYLLMAGDDADDEDLTKFVMEQAALSVVSGVPIVSGVANAFQGYGGGGVLATALEIPGNFGIQALQGDNDKAFRRSLAEGVGIMTGLPTTFMTRAGEGINDAIQGDGLPVSEMLFGRNPLTR